MHSYPGKVRNLVILPLYYKLQSIHFARYVSSTQTSSNIAIHALVHSIILERSRFIISSLIILYTNMIMWEPKHEQNFLLIPSLAFSRCTPISNSIYCVNLLRYVYMYSISIWWVALFAMDVWAHNFLIL